MQFELLTPVCAGEPLGPPIARAFSTLDAEPSAADLQQWFRQWTAAGYFPQLALIPPC